MSRNVVGLLVVTMCFGIVFLLRGSAPAEEQSKKPSEESTQFNNGVLLVKALKGAMVSDGELTMLRDAKLVQIGKRYFVRGKAYVAEEAKADKNYAWYDGIEVAIAWDSIVEFYDLTPKQAETYMALEEE